MSGRVSRLILCVLVAVASWLPVSSFASFPSQALYGAQTNTGYQNTASIYATPDAACQAAVPLENAANGAYNYVFTSSVVAGNKCLGDSFTKAGVLNGHGSVFAYWSLKNGVCPANSSASAGSSCTCNSGYVEDSAHTSCVVVPTACQLIQGSPIGAGEVSIPTTAMKVPTSTCSGGCTYSKTGGGGGVFGSLGGAWTWNSFSGLDWVATGATCSGTTTPGSVDVQPFPTPIPAGMCPGTVNGVAVTVPCDTTSTTTATVPAGAASGASSSSQGASATGPSGTASSPVGSVAGTSTTGSQVTCSNVTGQCQKTTTTSTNNADGTTTTSSKTEDIPKATFCKDNPGDPSCKDSESSFGGSCGAAFTCSGDAVQCAMAKEQYTRNCQNVTVDSDTKSTVDGLIAVTGTAPTAGDTSFSLASLMPSAPSGSCPLSDMTIAIGPGSISFPIATVMCPRLAMIRGVVVAFGFALWGLIVLGGARRS